VEGQSGDIANYFTKLATETAAGDAPDVMTLGGAYPLAYAARGALLDMSTVKTELDTGPFPKSILTASTYRNKLYGAPTGANALAVIANPKVVQAAGVPLPDDNKWTWDDLVDANRITKGTTRTASPARRSTVVTLSNAVQDRPRPPRIPATLGPGPRPSSGARAGA
jgi:multiple sugar transport system substrate-binding protein